MRSNSVWSLPGIHDRLVTLVNDGKSSTQIAERLSREFQPISRNSVIGYCHRYKVKLRTEPTRSQYRVVWTDEKNATLIRMLDEKRSDEYIAYNLGVGVQAFKKQAYKLGVTTKGRGQRKTKPKQSAPQPKPELPTRVSRFNPGTRNRPSQPRPKRSNTLPHADKPLCLPIDRLNDGMCKWPVTTFSPYLFCGRDVTEKSNYCEYHSYRSMNNVEEEEHGGERLPEPVAVE